MENTNKKSKGTIIVITILILIVLGLGGYLIYDKAIDKKETSNDIVENKEGQEVKKSEETEITDQLLINDIREKITIASSTNAMTELYPCKDNKCKINWIYYNDSILNSNITDADKTAIILINLFVDKQFDYFLTERSKTNISEEDYEQIKSYVEIYAPDDKFELDYEKVNEVTKKIFGIEASKSNVFDQFCPMFLYDAKSNKYFLKSIECGGTGPDSILYYINKYTTKDDNLYAYVNIGSYFIDDNDDFVLLDDSYTKNHDSDHVIKSFSSEEVDKYISNDEIYINENNYKDFQEYVFEFKKDSTGNYYLNKVTKN